MAPDKIVKSGMSDTPILADFQGEFEAKKGVRWVQHGCSVSAFMVQIDRGYAKQQSTEAGLGLGTKSPSLLCCSIKYILRYYSIHMVLFYRATD